MICGLLNILQKNHMQSVNIVIANICSLTMAILLLLISLPISGKTTRAILSCFRTN